jgi:hypothetical protein
VQCRCPNIIFCIQRKYTELISSVRQEECEEGKKGAGEVKGHAESDKEEVQESRDTGEKIEHPWGPVNQLVYSLQHRGLQTDLGDFQGLGEFICCSERRRAVGIELLHQDKSNGRSSGYSGKIAFRVTTSIRMQKLHLAGNDLAAYKVHSYKRP